MNDLPFGVFEKYGRLENPIFTTFFFYAESTLLDTVWIGTLTGLRMIRRTDVSVGGIEKLFYL